MNWISVKHKLPEEEEDVLVFDREEMHTATFTLSCSWCTADDQPAFVYDPNGEWNGKHWHLKEYYPTFETPATHWMPLPKPPIKWKHKKTGHIVEDGELVDMFEYEQYEKIK